MKNIKIFNNEDSLYEWYGKPSNGYEEPSLSLTNGGVNLNYSHIQQAGDIVLFREGRGDFITVNPNKYELTKYPQSDYTPIGVVVIPKSHDVYGDGTYGVMSLAYMSCSNPNTGCKVTDEAYMTNMHWGYGKIEITQKYDSIIATGSIGGITASKTGVSNASLIPTDYYTYGNASLDEVAYYHHDGKYGTTVSPSPYLKNGKKNDVYSQDTKSIFVHDNVLSDFNGKGNTAKMLTYASSQGNWQTASTIIDNHSNGYVPSACCCWRYVTPGTKQGDWYLPAFGEIGYLSARFKQINEGLKKINTIYGNDTAAQNDGNMEDSRLKLWSSTIASTSLLIKGSIAYYVDLSSITSSLQKDDDRGILCYVRAFIRL